MITKKSVIDMTRDEWLQERKKGLGGSDAATVIGLNSFSSRLYLYADKKGLVEEKETSEAMRLGNDLEEYVAQRWAEATGKKVRRNNHILYNDKYPWAFANIDREVVGEKAVLEIKTTSLRNKTDFEGGAIPPYYYAQITHYLAVTGYEKAYLAVLVLNKGFYHFEIERNEDEINALMKEEEAYWSNYIVPGIPPDADGSDSSQDILDTFERGEGTEILVGMDEVFDQLSETDEQIKELNKHKDLLRQTIIQALGDKTRGDSYRWTCTYLPQSRTSIDSKLLKEKFPTAYESCKKISEFNTFRTKLNKGATK